MGSCHLANWINQPWQRNILFVLKTLWSCGYSGCPCFLCRSNTVTGVRIACGGECSAFFALRQDWRRNKWKQATTDKRQAIDVTYKNIEYFHVNSLHQNYSDVAFKIIAVTRGECQKRFFCYIDYRSIRWLFVVAYCVIQRIPGASQ